MPSGPGTYGRQKGRPKKRRGKKSTDIMYEMIGESIWDTYSNMAYILAEKSALPRIETDDGEEEVAGPGYWSGDPHDVRHMKRRRKEFATHIKRIRKGKAEPEQQRVDPDAPHKENEYGESVPQPPRKGPGSPGGPAGRTHAQAAGDIKGDIMSSRGREAEGWIEDAEREVSAREKQAVKSRARATKKGK